MITGMNGKIEIASGFLNLTLRTTGRADSVSGFFVCRIYFILL